MAMLKYVIFFAVLAVSAVSSKSRGRISKESRMAIIVSMQDTMKECAKEFSVDMDDLKSKLKSHEGLDSIDKCFFQCIFKKKDAINDVGKFDAEKSLAQMKDIVKNEDDVKFLEDVAKDCVSVNDEEVSDGDKGCDRAMLMIACFKEHHADYV